jgi:hypothetical protein
MVQQEPPLTAQQRLDYWVKLGGFLLAVLTFSWGIYVYFHNNKKPDPPPRPINHELTDLRKDLFGQAMEAASTIATSSDSSQVKVATNKFWILYYGQLASVERQGVKTAMIEFGNALKEGKSQSELVGLSLHLAKACGQELESPIVN